MSATPISKDSVVSVSSTQMSSELAGEAVILDVQEGLYYGLDEVGASVWKLIQTPTTVAEIQAGIMEEYDVDAAQCEQDVIELIAELAEAGLVVVKNG